MKCIRKRDGQEYHAEVQRRTPEAKTLSVRLEPSWGGRVQYVTLADFKKAFTHPDGTAIQ